MYRSSGRSLREIAEELGIAPETLRRWVVRVEIACARARGAPLEPQTEAAVGFFCASSGGLRRCARERRGRRSIVGGTIVGLQEVVLWTQDIEKSLAFYRDLFGLSEYSPPDYTAKFLRAGDDIAGVPQVIVLVPHPDPEATFPREKLKRVLHHLAMVVDPNRYDEQRERCRDAGLEVRDGVHPLFKGVRTFYVDDPDGNEVELIARER